MAIGNNIVAVKETRKTELYSASVGDMSGYWHKFKELDEPMLGLDPKSAYVLKKTMRDYADSGKTVFFSSHILEVVEKICDRVAIIDGGKLIAVCDMQELKEKRSDLSLEQLFLTLTGGEDAFKTEEV